MTPFFFYTGCFCIFLPVIRMLMPKINREEPARRGTEINERDSQYSQGKEESIEEDLEEEELTLPDLKISDVDEDQNIQLKKLNYFELLKYKRVVFAMGIVTLNLTQYTFVDPILSDVMENDYGLTSSMVGVVFLALGLGYVVCC